MEPAEVVSKTNIYELEMIAEIDAEDKLTYIHTDVLGSTVLLTNEAAEITGRYEYDAFGGTIGYEGSEQTDYLFTNQEQDIESELYYYNARYYNPKLGRFISRDIKLGNAGDILSSNRYIYVKNNPLKYVDPTGMVEEDAGNAYFSAVKGWGDEIIKTGIDTVKNTWNSILHPIETAKNIGNFYKSTYNDGKVLVDDLIADWDGTVNEILTGTSISYEEFMLLSPEEQGRKIGRLTGYAIEAVLVKRASSKVLKIKNKGSNPVISNKNDIIGKPRTGSANKLDQYHNFPEMVDNYAGSGSKSIRIGADGLEYHWFEVPGGYLGKNGVFEWILDPKNDVITHRFFNTLK